MQDSDAGVPGCVIREVAGLKRLRHRNIVKLLDLDRCGGENILYLVFELLKYNLRDYLNDATGGKAPYQTAKTFLYQLLRGEQPLVAMPLVTVRHGQDLPVPAAAR